MVARAIFGSVGDDSAAQMLLRDKRMQYLFKELGVVRPRDGNTDEYFVWRLRWHTLVTKFSYSRHNEHETRKHARTPLPIQLRAVENPLSSSNGHRVPADHLGVVGVARLHFLNFHTVLYSIYPLETSGDLQETPWRRSICAIILP